MIRAAWGCADMFRWRQHQQDSDVLIELYSFMQVELVAECIFLAEAQVLEEQVDIRQECML